MSPRVTPSHAGPERSSFPPAARFKAIPVHPRLRPLAAQGLDWKDSWPKYSNPASAGRVAEHFPRLLGTKREGTVLSALQRCPPFPIPCQAPHLLLFLQLCQYSSPVLWWGSWADLGTKENAFFLYFFCRLCLFLTASFEGVVGSNVRAGIQVVIAQRSR